MVHLLLLSGAARATLVLVAGLGTQAMPPGSTIKPLLVAAALETHAITLDQQFECGPPPRLYGDQALQDHAVHGTLDLAHLLGVSRWAATSSRAGSSGSTSARRPASPARRPGAHPRTS